MRNKPLLALALSLLGAFATTAIAAPPRPATKSPFLESRPCLQKSYQAWIQEIRSRNSAFNPKALLLPLMFPRGDYDKAQQGLDCHYISYASDGLPVSGWMLAPKHAPGKRLPVVILNRGGNGGFGALKFADLFSHAIPIAERGFLVLASQYRGMDESDPKRFGRDEFGGADVRDVTRLIALVKDIPDADPDNVFLLGFSRGVMQSYLAARGRTDIRAMAMINGQVDLQADLAFRPEMEALYRARIPGYATDKAGVLRQRSALAWAEELPRSAPILLLHGSEDERVSPANGPKMKRRLDALHHRNALIVFEGEGHFLDKQRVVADVVAWFVGNLRR